MSAKSPYFPVSKALAAAMPAIVTGNADRHTLKQIQARTCNYFAPGAP